MSTKCVILRFFFTFCSKVAHVHQHVFTFLAEQFGQRLKSSWGWKPGSKTLFQPVLVSEYKTEFLPI